ncbi:IS30 family transposase, partial [Streptococcus suis]|nr:IS30 family transposase [Streptococcus suis]
MQEHYTPKGKHLTIDNRRLIERWKNENKSNREIAGLLGKAPQTIHNEVKRGTTLQQVRKGLYRKVYSADYAQTVYQSNRKRSVKKLILTKEIREKILHYHKQKFSPEMMVKKKQVKVGISTIYYWFHTGHLGLTKADMLYPRKRKGVKKQASSNFKPAGKSIEERPEVINLRLENGHYEIDTVLLTKVKNYCLIVLTDRRSRHQIIRLIPNKTAESVNQELTLLLGENRILSITADNGSEFKRLSEVFPEEHIYYAHAYSSWERGSNENHNR